MRHLRPIILTFALMVSMGMWAANYGANADTSIVKKYQDSLALYKARFDSIKNVHTQNGYASVNPKFYQLFSPLHFYNGVTHDLFGMETKKNESHDVNMALAKVYLDRPDLVKGTLTQLEQASLPASAVNATPAVAATIEELSNEAPIEADPEPVEVVVEKPKFWTFKGDGFLQFLQNFVSGNWYKGGESNYSLLSSLTLEANYDNKSKWKWDNKLEMKLGFLTSRSDTVNKFKSNEDLIRLTSKVGLQATKHWYYTLQMIAQTQFTRGLKVTIPAPIPTSCLHWMLSWVLVWITRWSGLTRNSREQSTFLHSLLTIAMWTVPFSTMETASSHGSLHVMELTKADITIPISVLSLR